MEQTPQQQSRGFYIVSRQSRMKPKELEVGTISCVLFESVPRQVPFGLAPHYRGRSQLFCLHSSFRWTPQCRCNGTSPQRTKSCFVRVQVELEGRGQRALQSQDTVFFLVKVQSSGWGRIQMIFAERLAPAVDTGYTHSKALQANGYVND